jgi:ABC-type multidrug transport system ATPase subunit
MVDKPLVFLDEATTGMDPINKRTTLDALRDQARAGRTIFLTTHILEEAEELCDTVAIIDQGKRVAMGDIPTIKSMIPSAFDVTITFEHLSDDLLSQFQKLPLLKFFRKQNTIEACIQSSDPATLATIARLAGDHGVRHFEVSSASLEDVFLQLLSGAGDRASPVGGARR